jgi:hypothetical protein
MWVLIIGASLGTASGAEAGDNARGRQTGRHAEPRQVRDTRVDVRVVRDDRRDIRDDRRDARDDRRDRWDDRDGRDRYFGSRDIVIVRDYYRPHYRPLPRGVRHVYVRHGHLPPGWARRIHVVPVHVERRLPPIPRGYRRGIIDGHVVVHNDRGFILDVAMLF